MPNTAVVNGAGEVLAVVDIATMKQNLAPNGTIYVDETAGTGIPQVKMHFDGAKFVSKSIPVQT